MPAAIVLKSGHVACAQEMVRDSRSPWITQTEHGEPCDEYFVQMQYGFGAAPFLVAAIDGSTLLAFHSSTRRPASPPGASLSWMFANVWVQRGDSEARNFGPATQPWPDLDASTGAFFASLLMKDERTVVALASFITQPTGEPARTVVRWIEGKLAQ
jgi:hypothetical protein